MRSNQSTQELSPVRSWNPTRTKEYSALEGTHNHQDQLLALCITPEDSQHVPESIVQKITELSRAGAVTSVPRELILVPNHPHGEEPWYPN